MSEPMTTFTSSNDLRRPGTAFVLRAVQVLTLLVLLAIGVGPLYWTVKGAVSPPTEMITHPLRLWPAEAELGNFARAFTELHVGRYLANTVTVVIGSWAVQLLVAMTAGFAFAVIRPRIGRYVYGAILATMFVPYTVSLVSLFLTVLDVGLLDTYWAIWLPAGANAFNVLLATRFFEALPQELYDAAKVDGAGTWQLLTKIVLPMSRPVIAVISLLAIMHSWKEFIWPLVVISDPKLQPISVALANLVDSAPLDELIAAMAMALAPPVLVFLVLQRYVVAGLGFTGVKG
ncbi:carbohydrate ABC transporter permease [Kribbella sp. C-35]|uniref:carbohydrate ABC transporter permease n=1 Tax=Kribbella sp. C-35 TaxID=2789276 RepID=UPI00397AF6B7